MRPDWELPRAGLRQTALTSVHARVEPNAARLESRGPEEHPDRQIAVRGRRVVIVLEPGHNADVPRPRFRSLIPS
jgi:hypothetical protein